MLAHAKSVQDLAQHLNTSLLFFSQCCFLRPSVVQVIDWPSVFQPKDYGHKVDSLCKPTYSDL